MKLRNCPVDGGSSSWNSEPVQQYTQVYVSMMCIVMISRSLQVLSRYHPSNALTKNRYSNASSFLAVGLHSVGLILQLSVTGPTLCSTKCRASPKWYLFVSCALAVGTHV